MILLVMVGEEVPQYIPDPLGQSPIAPVILNPEIRALFVESPSKVTVFVALKPWAVIVVELLPAPIKAIRLLIWTASV
ncbi:hypothetical protein KKG61_05625 [bacterium]|nr:hypothetical protein [bacterium]